MNADILKVRTPAELYLSEAFTAAKASLPGNMDVAKWRDDSFGVFSASGLPHRRVESWHYTDLRTLMREGLPLAHPPSRAACDTVRKELASAPVPKHRLVLVDGFFVPELSEGLPQGLKIRSLSSVLAEGRPDLIAQLSSQDLAVQDSIVSLNAALMQDGVVVEVEPGTVITEPVHLIHVTASLAPAARFSRSALIVGAGASIHFAESYQPANGHTGQTNACLIISLGDESALSHTAVLTGGAPRSLHIESVMAQIGAGAKFKSFALVSGIGLMRRQMFVRFEGAGSEALLSGVSLLAGREHADTTLRVQHAAQACVSRETFKYILDEEATGVFQGRIHVAPGAQKTDGKMLCKAILLSDMAAMSNKPELEIYADDVACGHGATCGGLDAGQLFYLQTRGLPFAQAESLLLEAFAGEVIDGIGNEGLIKAFRREISAWLSARHGHPVAAPLLGATA
ncbi:MAG: Fe-S cluster assembly protein SufD [Beijerinckiaceae bacterium]|nr:Fe-S cluster assembly protein SufD [Beijerinckiaceae bacterium]MCI0735998.1 Fe-S cluster assembly protein SufD [Beijerinckiaceae bacterium]